MEMDSVQPTEILKAASLGCSWAVKLVTKMVSQMEIDWDQSMAMNSVQPTEILKATSLGCSWAVKLVTKMVSKMEIDWDHSMAMKMAMKMALLSDYCWVHPMENSSEKLMAMRMAMHLAYLSAELKEIQMVLQMGSCSVQLTEIVKATSLVC